jgi:hypothetical protein
MKNRFTLFLSTLLSVIFFFNYMNSFGQNIGQAARMNINNIDLPLNNSGNIADVIVPDGGTTNGYFEGHEFLYSAGFFMSGFTNDSLWANGVQGTILLDDYQPGTVGMDPNDPNAAIYRVGTLDPPFGQSWQDWGYAVNLGADYYDGDGNGVYDPVDLNSNGIWDPDEDKPGIIGDESFWCVYNDGVPANERRWGSAPLGIEIRQTIFAFASSPQTTGNAVFVRYRIKNTGLIKDTLKDVYFCHFADADIGEINGYMLNYVGCDTLRNAGYTYLKGPSPQDWGDNPPSFLTGLLTGPLSYIPGVSFEDLNGNGIYDEGTDIPLDTAYSFRGPLGVPIYPGALNINMTSAIFGLGGDPNLGDPLTAIQAMNNLLGKTRTGAILDPCTWQYAQVFGGVPCSEVDPYYWVSGDPVSNTGWISTSDGDARNMISAGPFKLIKDKEIEILFAFIVGRGASALGSVTAAKDISDEIQNFYENNFGYPYVVGIKDKNINEPDFSLSQNYPNPFNPVTTIKYSVPDPGTSPAYRTGRFMKFVKLKVYDILGNEIATLVNEEKPVGRYEVKFDGSRLASGVYIYRLNAGNYSAVKKLVLLK